LDQSTPSDFGSDLEQEGGLFCGGILVLPIVW
jgi:hypothetical protein